MEFKTVIYRIACPRATSLKAKTASAWDGTAWAGKWTSVVRVGRREDRRSHLLQTINQLYPYPMPGPTLDL